MPLQSVSSSNRNSISTTNYLGDHTLTFWRETWGPSGFGKDFQREREGERETSTWDWADEGVECIDLVCAGCSKSEIKVEFNNWMAFVFSNGKKILQTSFFQEKLDHCVFI